MNLIISHYSHPQMHKSLPSYFNYGLYADHMKPVLYEMYRKNIDLMREVSRDWKCQPAMHRFLANYKGCMMDQVFLKIDEYHRGKFVVLCHGDFWSNNIMFKYDSKGEEIEECLLLDFQLCNVNSPAFDLNYFIFTSAHKDIKLEQIDHFIHVYFKALVVNLNLLGYTGYVPSLAQLHKEFQDIAAYALNSTYGTLCAVVAPAGSDMNILLSDDEESHEMRRRLFSNPLYVAALEELIPYFERKGLF